jgi:hypothetical protein
MKRYDVKFTLSHYADLAKSFDCLTAAQAYWRAHNGGKWHNGGVWDNQAPSSYKWVM